MLARCGLCAFTASTWRSGAGSGGLITQYGVLPYRVDAEGKLEFLLITSKERRRWVVPKGNPIPFLLNYESAAREAFEEAGVEGQIATVPIGTYRYDKRRRAGGAAPAIVTSIRCWSPARPTPGPSAASASCAGSRPAEAAESVEEPELSADDPVFQRGHRGFLSARLSRRHGRQPIFLGVPDAEILSRDHAEGGPLLRHVRAPRADPRRRRRRDGEDVRRRRGDRRILHATSPTHEHAADDVTRDVLVAVRRSFITPFDRSAITALTSAMDNAIDEMWQTAKAITLYEVDQLRAADAGDEPPGAARPRGWCSRRSR